MRDKNTSTRRNNAHGRTLSSSTAILCLVLLFSFLWFLSISPPSSSLYLFHMVEDHRVISRSIGPQGQKGSNETDTCRSHGGTCFLVEASSRKSRDGTAKHSFPKWFRIPFLPPRTNRARVEMAIVSFQELAIIRLIFIKMEKCTPQDKTFSFHFGNR